MVRPSFQLKGTEQPMYIRDFSQKVTAAFQKRSLADLFKQAFAYATHLITYHIMYIDTANMDFSLNSDIKVLPMTADDTEKLNDCSFGNQDFLKPILDRHDPHYRCYIFYNAHDEYIGFCCYMHKGAPYHTFDLSNTDAYLSEFYINPHFRSHGLGTAVLSETLRLLKMDGIHEVKLSVRNYNKPAIRCYRKSGFQLLKKYTVLIKHTGNAFPYHTI